MNCEDVRRRVPDLVAGHLRDDECAPIELHLVGCEGCAAYRDEVAEFYELDLSAIRQKSAQPVAVPDRSVRTIGTAVRPARRWTRRSVAAGLLPLLLLLGGLVVALKESRPALAIADVPEVRIDWPELPAREYPTGWLASAEEGRVYSQYTGKPLLESHIFPQCPRCKFIERVIADPLVEPKFDGFVRVRTVVKRKAPGPDWVAERVPRETEMFQLPAMRITDASCATEPQFSIGSLNQIVDLMGEFEKQCADERAALGASDYQRVHDAFERVRLALEEERFSDAHRELETVIAMGSEFRTAFVDRAKELDAALESQLTEVARFLEDALERKVYSRSSVRKVARSLAQRSESLAAHDALARIAE